MSDEAVSVPLSAIEELRRRQRLPVRLKREVPWSAETGCAIFIGMFVLAIVGGLYYALTHAKEGEKDLWIVHVFIWVFGFVGALLVFSGIHRWIASRVRETMVELEFEHVPRGRLTRVCFRQEGPVTLSSLRANVLCFELTYKWGTRTNSDGGTEQYKTTNEKLLYQQNILDEHDNVIAVEDIWETLVEYQLPDEAPSSFESEDRAIVWKIEVWGKVKWWPDFMHPFVIGVV